MTAPAFKRSIRDLQVWCSSCMVAFSGSDPIGVLIGAKRPSGTLVHKIAVHPDHVRQGHGRHLLASLGSKLAILGPPRIIAEVPETLAPACALFTASGYVQEAVLTDYVFSSPRDFVPRTPSHARSRGPHAPLRSRGSLASAQSREEDDAREVGQVLDDHARRFVIPVTVDDLAANGLLGEDHPPACWERSLETLTARKDDIAGLAVASDEQIEAYLLYMKDGEMMSLRSFVDDGGSRLRLLLSRVGVATLRFPKVHPEEISRELLDALGFRPANEHRVYAAAARSA